jgi:hypothetical protein
LEQTIRLGWYEKYLNGNSQFHNVHETLIIFLHQMQVQDSCHGVQKQKEKSETQSKKQNTLINKMCA